MAIEDRRERERAARRRLIVTTARRLAEAEGWDAVTTRRLSTEIEYSQPVLYKHFAGMEQIADAVAIDGFGELAEAMGAARSDADAAGDALTRVAHAYLDFARDNPAVYDAMFTRATSLRFAAEDTPPQLTAAFAELRHAVGARRRRTGRRHAHRGVLGRTARTGHPQPCRPTTPRLRLRTSPAARRTVHPMTKTFVGRLQPDLVLRFSCPTTVTPCLAIRKAIPRSAVEFDCTSARRTVIAIKSI